MLTSVELRATTEGQPAAAAERNRANCKRYYEKHRQAIAERRRIQRQASAGQRVRP